MCRSDYTSSCFFYSLDVKAIVDISIQESSSLFYAQNKKKKVFWEWKKRGFVPRHETDLPFLWFLFSKFVVHKLIMEKWRKRHKICIELFSCALFSIFWDIKRLFSVFFSFSHVMMNVIDNVHHVTYNFAQL